MVYIIESQGFAAASRPSGTDLRIVVSASAVLLFSDTAAFDQPLLFRHQGAQNVGDMVCAPHRNAVSKAGGPQAPAENTAKDMARKVMNMT